MDNYYQILGIDKSATEEEIRKRYLFLVKAYHPDRYQDPRDKESAEEELKKVNEAFSVIGNKAQRIKYDTEVFNKCSDTSSQETSHQQSTSKSEEEIKAIIEYFNYLLSKWNFILQDISLSQIEVKSFAQLTEVIDYFFVKSKSISEPENEKILKDTYEIVEYIARIQIALGIEFESNNETLKFPKEKLLQSSIYPLLITLDELLQKITFSEKQSILAAIKNFPNVALSSAEYLFTFGQNKYKKFSQKTKNYAPPTTQKKSSETVNNYCEGCGRVNITKKSTYRKNIGMVFRRRYSKVEGMFCPSCQERLFWNALFTNLFLGWWGTISLVINPFLILMNIGNYINSWDIRVEDDTKKLSRVDWKLFVPICIVFIVIVMSLSNTNGLLSNSEYSPTATNTPQLKTLPPEQVAIPLPTNSPRPTSTLKAKVLVTVINNYSKPQEIYCEGIYIFTLKSGEKNTFRFQQGNWRIDVCYPGSYPCKNFKYVDMNHDSLTYTIH